ncbi:hypothetical protein LZQ00_14935 [Sphingobacterium sp. SRCM116780]|uniref:hypothetical protein n=1 Tax=Sphingobacterium sp. SRCM116780 TaxID=2907623 RepID=UPI001F479609|nr:hypothetical protein [Sphingobacterium sp. SRCM116780]UIR55552.1 hypothetical protein LZQ00_14935 [Sphingobacterium sp. SRCM116780]
MMMIKTFVAIALSFCFFILKGQEKLYYVMSADSTKVGVRDEKGTIVIPLLYPVYQDYDLNTPIEEPLIEFIGVMEQEDYDKDSPAFAVATVYNRKGQLLYYPQFFDNGSDYWSEGLRRYVEKGKIGFVDFLGNRITAANWGFAVPFNYGYATVYEGKMKKQYEAGGEHWTVIPADEHVKEYLINKNGVRVEPLKTKQHAKDYRYDGEYYPNPFQYNKEEQAILNRLSRYETAITLLFKLSSYQYEYEPLQLEIVEKPNHSLPYYVIEAYDDQRRLDDYEILFDEKTDNFFISRWSSRTELVPLDEMLMSSIQDDLQRDPDYIKPETRKLAEEEWLKLKATPK